MSNLPSSNSRWFLLADRVGSESCLPLHSQWLGGALMACLLGGCAANPSSDPAEGGLFDTLQGLGSGSYQQHLQTQRATLKTLRQGNTVKQQELAELHEKRLAVGREAGRLQHQLHQSGQEDTAQEERIQSLSRQRADVLATARAMRLAGSALESSINQIQNNNRQQDERIRELLKQRDQLRQQLEILIKDGSV